MNGRQDIAAFLSRKWTQELSNLNQRAGEPSTSVPVARVLPKGMIMSAKGHIMSEPVPGNPWSAVTASPDSFSGPEAQIYRRLGSVRVGRGILKLCADQIDADGLEKTRLKLISLRD